MLMRPGIKLAVWGKDGQWVVSPADSAFLPGLESPRELVEQRGSEWVAGQCWGVDEAKLG